MKRLSIVFGIIITMMSSVVYGAGLKSEINTTISQSGINRGAISISVKDFHSGKIVYELNSDTPISPASTQKIITTTPAFMTLGEDYQFSTKLYKNSNNEYLFVLGADPYLNTKDLDKLVKCMPKEPASVNIDASVIDDNEWGEGWQWDDDLNPLMPKFSAYNIDKNLMEIIISPSVKGYPAEIKTEVKYPLSFVNNIITDKETKYTIKRQNHISPDVLVMNGTIKYNKSDIIKIPINNPKKYFKLRLSDLIIDHNISCSGIYQDKKLNNNYTLITLLSHEINQAKKDVYRNSNNMIAETVFKLAGGKFSSSTGTFENGLEMFNNFCKTHNIDTSNIRIVDASGVSKNNLMTADFMTDFLLKVQGYLEPELPTAGEGTLTNRMLYLKGNIHAKTGTLSNISAITGYITSQKEQKYVFSIMINDSKTSPADKKMLEEYILRTIYTKG